ncbi:hypothetical protein [Streptomyces sp. MNP-20]|uniref:hypothetical protein n=1 Tax=Streptomyces sp. MNP-20 TaxID=2721165 RepID=UPI001556D2AE|nr:hypothetical protein [Streptomyces sp. MNP-20]
MRGQRTEQTQEALAYVRRTLGPADPVCEDADAARTPEGRAALARILAEPAGGERRPRTTRRRWIVVVTAMVTLAGVTAVADATGVLPSGVIEGLTRAGADDFGEVDLKKARMLVEGPTPDGRTMQVWHAPNASGGGCLHTRYLTDDGTAQGGDSECWNGEGADPLDRMRLWSGGGGGTHGYYTTYGHAAKPAVAVRITWPDGARETVQLNANGYFLTFSRHSVMGPNGEFEYRTIDALDPDGKTVASDPYA